MEDLTGKQFGPYQIVAPLGEGGMAAVYKAYQPSMERFVAIKVLPRQMAHSEEFIARFKREARLLAQLQHPHILSVFDYGESDGYTYIAMPFVQSGTLADLLKTRKLSLPEIRKIITQIGDALGYAHVRGMIHRDIKPSNVLIDESGNCLLTDFGLARMAEATSKLTSSGAIMGTPAYMSPEQGTGNPLDGRSDIYSLGIILYEMITGRVPFAAETPIAIVFKHIQDPLPSARKLAPNLSEELELVLLKSLAKSPADRYQSAEEFVQAVQMAIPVTLSGLKTTAPAPAPAPTMVSQPPQVAPPTNTPTVYEPVSAPPRPVSQPAVSAPPASQPPSYRPVSQPSIATAAPRKLPLLALAGVGVVGFGIIGIIVLVVGYNLIRNNLATSPTTAPTPAAENTATAVLPSAPPTSAANLEILPGSSFRDEFDAQLVEGWVWESEDPAKWSLENVPGWLQLTATDTNFSSPGLPTNLLLREAPPGDFELTTRVRFVPTSNFQFAGLVIVGGEGNAIQFGRAFCDIVNQCVGDGIYMDNIENTAISETSYTAAINGESVFLRLRKAGNTYSAYYGPDGANWTLMGQHTHDFPSIRVGLLAAQSGETISADFDYFALSQLPGITANATLECRAEPVEEAEIRATLQPGASTTLLGSSANGGWLNLQNPDYPTETCWVANQGAAVAGLVPVIDPAQATPTLPAPPTVAIPAGVPFVRINSIELNDSNQYVVNYETFEYTENLPGVHIHFFFNTVPFSQAGTPGSGPWILYGGPRPFQKYRASDRPQNASMLCALVANANHSVQPESGNCFPLPDVVSATARVETACRNAPTATGEVIASFKAGASVLLRGISEDQGWLSIQNPETIDASSCWVPLDSSVVNGNVNQLPIVTP